jgi:AcrR family transcriptional regulator
MALKATPKSEATRARILASALQVFRERGFANSTMREIASAAGVAVGAAYYYFDSKDALVMAFYEESQARMIPELDRVLSESRTLEQRLRGLIEHKFEVFGANRALMAALSAHIDPQHPLSPFSKHTASIRERDTAFFERAVVDSSVRLPPSILPYLPRLLWLYQMGLMLYWVYDRSPHQAHTRLLLDKTLYMMLLAIKLGHVSLLRPLYRPAGELLKTLYGELPQ